MNEHELEQLRFPVGKRAILESYSPELLRSYISVIENFPNTLKPEVIHLTDQQLDTPYRPGGWTIRQVVHHCADSHMNAFIRFKLALTEDTPVIRPYLQDRFAELADAKMFPIHSSLQILEGVHLRWSALLHAMKPEDFLRSFIHPEKNSEMKLNEVTAMYTWHCHHHLAHITHLKQRSAWK
jgi:hypothetical protein